MLLTVEPQIFVTDMPRAIGFFVDKLGFGISLTYGEPPFYAQVVRDAARLNLRHVDRPVIDRGVESDLLSASITVSDAGGLFVEFQDRGVPFRETLTRKPWHEDGQGSFIIEAPDGNLLLFAGSWLA